MLPPTLMMEEANWMQNMEGDLDTVRLDWVHDKLSKDAPFAGTGVPGFWNGAKRPPRLHLVPSDYGAFYFAIPTLEDGRDRNRINQCIFPFHTIILSNTHAGLRSFVPIDDVWTMLIRQQGKPGTEHRSQRL